MKKHFLALALCVAAMSASATVLKEEIFTDFPTGWNTSGSVTTGAGRTLEETALTYSNTGGTYALSGKGKAVKSALDASSSYFHTKALPDSIGAGTFYVSFIYRADNKQSQSQAQIFGLSASETSAALRFWVGKDPAGDATKCRVGITRASGKGAEVQWGSTLINVNEEHLIVMKYSIEDSLATLYVDPTIGGTEPATPFASDGSYSFAKKYFKYMCLYSTGNTKTYFTMGGVRISTTWAEAVGSGAAAPQETPDYAATLFANFSDSTLWTNTLASAPASAAFPTDTVADYVFTSTAIVKSGKTLYFDTDSIDFVKFYARAHMDKSNYNASIEVPFVAHIDTLYLYGHAGSDSKNLRIEYRVANGKWTSLSTVTMMKADAIYAVPVKMDNVKLRIANATTSSQYLYYMGAAHPRSFADHKQTTAVEAINANEGAVKMIENGQIVILKNGRKYNALGAEIK